MIQKLDKRALAMRIFGKDTEEKTGEVGTEAEDDSKSENVTL